MRSPRPQKKPMSFSSQLRSELKSMSQNQPAMMDIPNEREEIRYVAPTMAARGPKVIMRSEKGLDAALISCAVATSTFYDVVRTLILGLTLAMIIVPVCVMNPTGYPALLTEYPLLLASVTAVPTILATLALLLSTVASLTVRTVMASAGDRGRLDPTLVQLTVGLRVGSAVPPVLFGAALIVCYTHRVFDARLDVTSSATLIPWYLLYLLRLVLLAVPALPGLAIFSPRPPQSLTMRCFSELDKAAPTEGAGHVGTGYRHLVDVLLEAERAPEDGAGPPSPRRDSVST